MALNLTLRQIVCFGLGGLVGIPAYLLTRGSIGGDGAAMLMVGLMLPFFAFGIYEKDGQPLEKALWNFISASFLRPAARPYRTKNGYAAFVRQTGTHKEEHRIERQKTGRAGKKAAGRKKTV